MLPWFAGSQCPLFLAPMAGFTDVAFRDLCKQHGADVVVTEFVQSEALLRNVPRAWRSVDFTEAQRPAGAQLFGAKPAQMARAARLVVERLRPDFIDINCGCPAENVVERNGGAGLMRKPELAAEIVAEVVRAVPGTPVTAKMRIGWDAASIVAEEFAWRLEDAGASAITVHGRTKVQGYGGVADWDAIARVVAAVRVPVVGNGDIRDGATAAQRLRESGVAGLMVGRAALGNPWLFGEIKAALRGEAAPAPPTEAERWATLRHYAEILARRRKTGAYIARPSELGKADDDGDRDDRDDDGDDDDDRDDRDDRDANGDGGGGNGGGDDNVRWLLTRLLPLTHGLAGSRKIRAQLSSCRTLDDILHLTPAP
ncbi:MAG: tRNA dihydrouridine synthase DusB [Puniceicoccales bacterium]|jgi:nifR3 family TIM-barrel protein|nr:tRNA dihydrouridine synthase DusB [Puniceicoccales bacterium]